MSETETQRRRKRHMTTHSNKRHRKRQRKAATARQHPGSTQPNPSPIAMHDPWSGDMHSTDVHDAIDRRFDPWSSDAHGDAHSEAHGEEHAEHNPILTGLADAENAHLYVDVLLDGATELKDLPEHAMEVLHGEGSLVESASAYTGLIIGPLAMGAGAYEVIEGAEEYQHDKIGGGMTIAEGTLGAASGAASLMGSAGWINPAWGMSAASAKAGLEIGHYSDNRAKELGAFRDDEGRAETASQWVSETAVSAREWTREHTGNNTIADLAGGAAFDGALFYGTAKAVGVAAADLGSSMGKQAARAQRAASYAGLTMNGEAPVFDRIGRTDPKTGEVTFESADVAGRLRAAEQMAIEDDKREEAIARSKLLFPERWGLPPNPVSIVHHTAMAAKRGGSK